MRKIAHAFAAAAAVSLAAPAQTAITTTSYTFSGNPGAVFAPGTFSLDFNDATNVYTLNGFNFTLGITAYDTSMVTLASFDANNLIIYDPFLNGALVGQPFDDFSFLFNILSTGPQARTLTYHLQGEGPNREDIIVITPVNTPAVPEPASWALILIGFGTIGWQMRRHRSARRPQLTGLAC